MFPKWAKSDSKIASFMKELDPNKTYAEVEMKEYAKSKGISTSLNSLCNVKIGVSDGWGIILKKIESSYKLQEDLRVAFNKYF